MKNIIMSSMVVLILVGCGAETEEEKNQQKAVIKGLDILYNMGKQSQEGASDEEVQNSGLDQLAKGLGELLEDSETPLTEEEKKSLQDGADLLKDGGKGLKKEVLKALTKELESEESNNTETNEDKNESAN